MDTTERPAPYLTIKDTADHYQVATKTVYRWIATGLEALNVGSAKRPDYRLRLEDVERFLRERQAGVQGGASAASSTGGDDPPISEEAD